MLPDHVGEAGMRSRHHSHALSDEHSTTPVLAAAAAGGAATPPVTALAVLPTQQQQQQQQQLSEGTTTILPESDKDHSNVAAGDAADDAAAESGDKEDLEDHESLFLSLSPSAFFEFHPPNSFTDITRAGFRQFSSGAFQQFCNFIGFTMVSMVVGKTYDERTLASVSAGISTMAIFAMSICVGLAAALDGMVSAAYGRKDFPAVVRITQIALLVVTAISSVLSIFIFLFGKTAVRVVFGEAYIDGAYNFLLGGILNLVINPIASCLSKSLQACQRADVAARASLMASIACVPACLVLIPWLGPAGAGLSIGVSALTNLSVIVYSIYTDAQNPLLHGHGWSLSRILRQDLQEVEEFMRVGAACYVAVSAEWLMFECLFVIAARLGKPEILAALNIVFQLLSVSFAFPAGLSVAASSLIGKTLGERRPRTAMAFCRGVILWSVVLPVIPAALVLFAHEAIFGLYLNDETRPKILPHIKSVLVVFTVSIFCDSLQYTLQAVYRGAGRASKAPPIVLEAAKCSYLAAYKPATYCSTAACGAKFPGASCSAGLGSDPHLCENKQWLRENSLIDGSERTA